MFPTAADSFSTDFGCGWVDMSCLVAEKMSGWIGGVVLWLAETTIDTGGFQPGTALWDTAISQSGIWLGLATLVMMLTGIVGITAGAVMMRPDLIKRTIIGTLLAFPATIFAYFVVGEGLKVIDSLSTGLLTRLGGQDGFEAFIRTVLAGGSGIDRGSRFVLKLTAGGDGPVIIGQVLFVLIILMLGIALIAFAMAFRDFVLLLLIAFAPLAFVLLPAQGGGTWVKRWVAAVTAMALAKPLTIGVLGLVMAGFSNTDTVWSAAGFASLIGLFIASFMPIMLYSFFQFIGGDGGAGDQVGSRSAQTAQAAPQKAASWLQNRGAPQKPSPAPSTSSAGVSRTAAPVGSSATKAGGASAGADSPRPGANVGTRSTFDAPTTPKPASPTPPSRP